MNICILNLTIFSLLTFSAYIHKLKKTHNLLIAFKNDFSNNNIFICAVILFLSFTAAFRSPYGLSQDYTTYQEIFKNSFLSVKNLFDIYPTNDIGYIILNKMFYLICKDFIIFIGCLAFFNIYTLIILFKRKSTMIWLSILLLLTLGSYYISYNAIRQFIAADLFIWAIYYIENKNIKKYTVLMLLAILIHKSAIFLYPLYWLLDISLYEKLNMKKTILLIILFILVYINIDKIMAIVQMILFKNYSYNDYGMDGMNFTSIIRPLLITIILIIQIKTLDFKKTFNRIGFNSTIIWLLLSIISLKVFNISRFTYFFIPLSIALLPSCITNESNKKRKIFLVIFMVLIALVYGFLTQSGANDTLLIGEML